MQEQIDKTRQAAAALDIAEVAQMEEIGPRGDFTKDTVNRFIRAINEMLKSFAAPNIAEVDESIEDGPLPPQLVKSLMMINAALSDAKMDEYQFSVDDLTTDRDLVMARGKIESAAKDRAFQAFLAKPQPEGDIEVSVETEVERAPAQPDVEVEEDEEDLFMSRMA